MFRYEEPRWTIVETFRPPNIREAFRTAIGRVEDAVPGSLAKAAELDDAEFQSTGRRKRRYLAESPELLYLDSPHLKESAEPVGDYYVDTHIAWLRVPVVLKLLCQAAGIRFGEAKEPTATE